MRCSIFILSILLIISLFLLSGCSQGEPYFIPEEECPISIDIIDEFPSTAEFNSMSINGVVKSKVLSPTTESRTTLYYISYNGETYELARSFGPFIYKDMDKIKNLIGERVVLNGKIKRYGENNYLFFIESCN